MDTNRIPIPDTDFTLEQLDNELLLYHPTKTTTVYMNETASIIWRLCDGERTIGEIVELISDSYPESNVSLEQDIEGTLKMFVDFGAMKI